MRILVVGASGFIGNSLLRAVLARKDEAIATGRDARSLGRRLSPGAKAVAWDPNAGPIPVEALEGVDAVVNLAGEPVTGRWTSAKKERIRRSRVEGTRNLVAGIAAAPKKPLVLVSASAIGYYGDGQHRVLHEGTPPAKDFLAGVCREWEGEAEKARSHCRVAIARIGVVLGKGGGAYPQMSRPFRFFAGGRIGLGYRWFSWIHIDDVVGAILHLIDTRSAEGPFNLTAPQPVSNREFTAALAKTLRRPALFPVPPIALRILLGGFSEVVLTSQRVVPLRTQAAGYSYRYPDIAAALADLR